MDGDRRVSQVVTGEGERREHASVSGASEPVAAKEWGRHPINIRLSLPLGFGRYYVTVVAGRERRSRERIASERDRHPLVSLGNLSVFFSFGVICGLAALALIQFGAAYLLLRSGAMVVGQ